MSGLQLRQNASRLRRDGEDIVEATREIRQAVEIVPLPDEQCIAVRLENDVGFGGDRAAAVLPALYPEWLGDRGFLHAHGLRFPYVVGEMARGIATADMVIAAARAGLLGFFGAAGLSVPDVNRAIERISRELDPLQLPWGVNLIHSPDDPDLEEALVDLYLARGVARVSASAFMALSPAIVRYAVTGLRCDANGAIVRRNHVFAKVSRTEVAKAFMQPPPESMLAMLADRGKVSQEEAECAARVSVAGDITGEADSGGHTDNRPLAVLLPQLVALRNRIARERGYAVAPRVGAAGGLGTPAAVAAAFAAGADYVLTGSVNQAAVESGLSPLGRSLLAEARSTDMTMAPSADMFEMGVKVQVLRKGLFFPMRAARLYELYRTYDSLEALPEDVIAPLETDVFRQPLSEIWNKTKAYFTTRDPAQLARAARDSHHRMALVFRWYLGNSSRWPLEGTTDRIADFQIWCGPAMGAFNDWTADTFLAELGERTVIQIALNLLEGAAVICRAQQLRVAGIDVPAAAFDPRPIRLAVD